MAKAGETEYLNLRATSERALCAVHGNGGGLFMPQAWVTRLEKACQAEGSGSILAQAVQRFLATTSSSGNYVRLSKEHHDALLDALSAVHSE